jgi:hypothetical protein
MMNAVGVCITEGMIVAVAVAVVVVCMEMSMVTEDASLLRLRRLKT